MDKEIWFAIEIRKDDRWETYYNFPEDELDKARSKLLKMNANVPAIFAEVRLCKMTRTKEIIA